MVLPTAILNDLLFKIAVRSDRLCILVAGLRDAFVTVYNLQRTNRGLGLHFREVLCGRRKMMTAMCFGFQSDQLRPGALWLPKPTKTLCYLVAGLPPDYRVLSLPVGHSSQMEVLNVIPTGKRWPAGELLPSRQTICPNSLRPNRVRSSSSCVFRSHVLQQQHSRAL